MGASTTCRVSRALDFQRLMTEPLEAGETLQERFHGAAKAAKLRPSKAADLWTMVDDTIKRGPTADWQQLHRAFIDATRPSGFEKFLEFWKAGLLGLPTQVVNVGTNALFRGLRDTEHGVGILADQFFAGVTGKERSRSVSEVSGRLLGARHAYSEAFGDLRTALGEIASLKPLSVDSSVDDIDTRNAIAGRKGEFIRIPFKFLSAFDNFFKHVARTQEYGAQSARLAHDASMRSPGESVQHAQARIFDEIRRVEGSPVTSAALFKKYNDAGVFATARDAADADTFQTKLGPRMRAIHQATQAHPATQLLVPFFKTPYNVLSEAVARTPAGALWAINRYLAGDITDSKFVDSMVKSAIGTSLMGLVGAAALEGAITGSGPTEPREAELLKRTGWQPRSIRIGDSYYSYQRLAPFSILFGLAADMADAWKSKDVTSASEALEKGVQMVTENVLDQSFVSGIDSGVKILSDPSRQGLTEIKRLQSSLIPNVVGVIPVAHAARALDPTYRETEPFTASPFLAQIPFASETLEPQRTPTGEIRERKGTAIERLLSPFSRSPVEEGPIADAAGEISRLGIGLSPPAPSFKVGTDRIYYTSQEREEIGRAQEKAMTEIGRLIRSQRYLRLPDSEDASSRAGQPTKKDAINAIVRRYRQPVVERANRIARRRARLEDRG